MSESVSLLLAILFPVLAGTALLVVRKKDDRKIILAYVGVVLGITGVLVINALTTKETEIVLFELMEHVPIVLKLDGFGKLFLAIVSIVWILAGCFSFTYMKHEKNEKRYFGFYLVTFGVLIGLGCAGNLITMYAFYEFMTLVSFPLVIHNQSKEAVMAGLKYLFYSFFGAYMALFGLFFLCRYTTTLTFTAGGTLNMELAAGHETLLLVAACLMLVGFGVKAGMFPLHAWLPTAHPVAPAPASALLSGILTKAGMFGILVLTSYLFLGCTAWGALILIIGVCTMVVGAVLALFSIDIKRTLACSSVSQIGFILVGVGMSGLLGEENLLAVRGSLLHMVNHSLIKLALFMAAGVIFMNVHELNLNKIRGFGRKKPLLNYIFLMGALGIGGMPLWNGYVSKTLIHESIVEYTKLLEGGTASSIFSIGAMKGIEWAFLISGGLTVAYMTKLYVAVFVEKNSDSAVQEKYDNLRGTYMNGLSATVLTISATLLPIMGLLPGQVMSRVADLGQGFMQVEKEADKVAWFSFENLKGAAISILIGAIIYLVIVRFWMMKKENGSIVYINRWNQYLDLENLIYRPILLGALPFVFGVVCRVLDSMIDAVVVFLRKTVYRDSKLPHELAEGTFLTHAGGCFVNGMQRVANATVFRKHPKEVDYEHKFALLQEEWSEDTTIIGRSLSFGLLLFCAGLIITVVYLLV